MSDVIDERDQLYRLGGLPTNTVELKRAGLYEKGKFYTYFTCTIPLILSVLLTFAGLDDGWNNIITFVLNTYMLIIVLCMGIISFSLYFTLVNKGESFLTFAKSGSAFLTIAGKIGLFYHIIVELAMLLLFIYSGWFVYGTIWLGLLIVLHIHRMSCKRFALFALGAYRMGHDMEYAANLLKRTS
jgi:hypothetical protein